MEEGRPGNTITHEAKKMRKVDYIFMISFVIVAIALAATWGVFSASHDMNPPTSYGETSWELECVHFTIAECNEVVYDEATDYNTLAGNTGSFQLICQDACTRYVQIGKVKNEN